MESKLNLKSRLGGGRGHLLLLVAAEMMACGGGEPVDDRRAPAGGAAGVVDATAAMAQDASSNANSMATAVGPTIQAPALSPVQVRGGAVGAECKPGHYTGSFAGDYRTPVWLNGEEPVPFATSDAETRPGFEFWLRKVERDCGGTEFCADFVVEGGKVRGLATPFTDPNAAEAGAGFQVRFEIDLVGELDCETGVFHGLLENGCYDIFASLFRFDGSIQAQFDHTSSSFTDGSWDATEAVAMNGLPPPPMGFGGGGQWQATWVDDEPAPVELGAGLCDGETGFDAP